MHVDANPNQPNEVQESSSCENAVKSSRTEKSCLTVTNVPACVFISDEGKEEFENLIKEYGAIVSIIYLQSFRRARVLYHKEDDSCSAKAKLNDLTFHGNKLKAYFTQIPCSPALSSVSTSTLLHPPPPVKQFVISPPASPPVNWKPTTEASPVVNHELLTAIARLKPNQPFEAHVATGDEPSITIHWCEEEDKSGEKKDHPLCNLPRHVVQTQKPNT